MEAAARGERMATATHDESAVVRSDVVRPKSMAVAETRRSRRTCVVAQRTRWLGATIVGARKRGASVEAAAARCYAMKRRLGRLAFERDAINNVCHRGTPGVCRRQRRSSAYVAGDDAASTVAIGVSAPGRVRGRGDIDDGSYPNSDDGDVVA
ncbi:hypothetical protein VPH35_117508 [Triticum aestivum]